MIYGVFSVFDTKAEAYMQPFYSSTNATAIRSITESTRDLNHNFSKYSSDYVLFRLSTFDDSSGEFVMSLSNLGSVSNFCEKLSS